MKIDQDRMEHGSLMAAVIRRGRGSIPWFVFTDAEMKPLATSDGPEGNIGCPVMAKEISHFIDMLHKVRKNMNEADVAAVQNALEANAEKILSKRKR